MDIMRKENTFPPPSGRRDLLSSPGVDPALRSPKRLVHARDILVKRRSGNNLSDESLLVVKLADCNSLVIQRRLIASTQAQKGGWPECSGTVAGIHRN